MKEKHIIEDETPIIPWIIAESVGAEAYQITGNEKQVDALKPYLVGKAETIYQNNDIFRRDMKKDSGRDKLCMFMRQWAAAFLIRDGVPRSSVPARWINGLSLPQTPTKSGEQK